MKNIKPIWKQDGLNFLGRILSITNLKRRWVIEETKVRGDEPDKMKTVQFLDKWIKNLELLKEEIIRTRS